MNQTFLMNVDFKTPCDAKSRAIFGNQMYLTDLKTKDRHDVAFGCFSPNCSFKLYFSKRKWHGTYILNIGKSDSFHSQQCTKCNDRQLLFWLLFEKEHYLKKHSNYIPQFNLIECLSNSIESDYLILNEMNMECRAPEFFFDTSYSYSDNIYDQKYPIFDKSILRLLSLSATFPECFNEEFIPDIV